MALYHPHCECAVDEAMVPKTVHAQETYKERIEGVGSGGQCDWVHLSLPSVHWQGEVLREGSW